ncbi:MAG: DUF4406 domain-containing protein [Bacteroidales bacterium]|nr:DUF4406 domain-containing protein [Bacteroidales bacterium]
MNIYISGPITGRSEAECEMKFNKAQNEIEKLGHTAVNPWQIGKLLPKNLSHKDFMDIDKEILVKCDAIYMMPDWNKSKGCREEHRLMVILDDCIDDSTKIFYELSEIPDNNHPKSEA